MAKGGARRASVHPNKKPEKAGSVNHSTDKNNQLSANNDETATLNSSIMSGGLSQTGNFFNDFQSYS